MTALDMQLQQKQHDQFGLATINSVAQTFPVATTARGMARLTDLLAHAPASIEAALDDWDAICDAVSGALAALGEGPPWMPLAEAAFAPPLSRPSAMYCSGANYYDHIAEMNAQQPDKSVEDAFHFLISPAAMTGHLQPVIRPAGAENLDWEAELVAVIGRRAERVAEADALQYVAGYTVANDVSVRDASMRHPIFGARWISSKGQVTMKPIGPSVVPARFVSDPMSLRVSTHVNGEERQASNTNQMIWSLQEQIASLSRKVPLLPGDLILTGTPAGTAAGHGGQYLADGDVVTVNVEGIGTLTNTIVAAAG